MARTGPYAAAQLWKLDNIHGRYFNLAGHIAPFLGDPTELVPEEWLELYRNTGRFVLPGLIAGMPAKFNVFAEDARGTGRLVWTCTRSNPMPTLRTIPRNGTRRGYYKIQFEIAEPEEFLDDWHERWGTCWPLVVDNGEAVVHPAFEGIYKRAWEVNLQWYAHVDRHRARLPTPWALTGRAVDEESDA